MTPIQEAVLLASVMIAVALLAVFAVIPQAVAQYAPLAVLPFVLRRRQNCAAGFLGRGA